MKQRAARWWMGAATCVAALSFAGHADAVIVEKVVAVVGERPILLSELRKRGRPQRVQIRSKAKDDNQAEAAETEMYRELLTLMVDERLEESAADKAHLAVSSEEIDHAIQRVAAEAHVTQGDLFAEVRRIGMNEQEYRDALRRQLLDAKLIELRVRSRVRVSEQDARGAYQKWRDEIRNQQPVDLRLLAIRVPPGMSEEVVRDRTRLAADIVRRARAGEDFCALVSKYTEDVETRDKCGSRGAQPMAALFAQIQDAVRPMKPGEISDPITIRAGGPSDAIIIVQLQNAPKIPAFEDVQAEMGQHAMQEGLERAHKAWLQELKRGVYIDIRL